MVSAATSPAGAVLDPAFVAAFRSGTLTRSAVEAALPADRGAILFFLMQLMTAVADGSGPAVGPHTPSGAVPPYQKPATDPKKRTGKAGAKPGHAGSSRPKPEDITRREEHQFPACPDCGGELRRTGRKRTRIIEDIPPDLTADVAEHTTHRDWCPHCKKQVEPKVPDALARCILGNRAVALAGWLHYGLGTTTSQIVAVFNRHLRLPISDGGLTQMWHRLARVVTPWYEQIHRHCLDAGVLHADETGWRTNGELWWLWCFTTADATGYVLHESRGHEALRAFFKAEFAGVLVTDFWKAYDVITRRQQKCWPHLLRDLTAVDDGSEHHGDWPEFAGKLRRIYADAIRLEATHDTAEQTTYDRRTCLLYARVADLAAAGWTNPHARRLAKRLNAYGDQLLTFVEADGVPPSNNHAEREVRPAVLMRKNSYGSQSVRGASTRGVLMSVFRTLHRRGLDPLAAVEHALRAYAATGELPPLPEGKCSGG
ncbi:MAG TPA: IS66 family transposase [Fimbriiglobus sp.]|jgi:transposase